LDERKIETHVEYCKHLLDVAKVHRDAAGQVEQQTKQRLEVTRQIALAEEVSARKKEARGRIKASNAAGTTHSSNSAGKRKDRSKHEDEDGESGKRRRRGGKRRKDQKTKMPYKEEEEDQYRNEQEEDDYATMTGDDKSGKAPDHLLVSVGVDDYDAEDETGHPQSVMESDDNEPVQIPAEPCPGANDPSE
jgi:RNA polymerase-associated protein CTR9